MGASQIMHVSEAQKIASNRFASLFGEVRGQVLPTNNGAWMMSELIKKAFDLGISIEDKRMWCYVS